MKAKNFFVIFAGVLGILSLAFFAIGESFTGFVFFVFFLLVSSFYFYYQGVR